MKIFEYTFYCMLGLMLCVLLLGMALDANKPPKLYTVTQNQNSTPNLIIYDCWLGGCSFKDPEGKDHIFQGEFQQVEQ